MKKMVMMTMKKMVMMTMMIKTKMMMMAKVAETDQSDLVWRHQYELHIVMRMRAMMMREGIIMG